MERSGLVHLYWGEGKGKTTAAMGLALRALGAGWQVNVVQFLKNGSSSELDPLARLGACIFSGDGEMKFVSQMTQAERAAQRSRQTQLLRRALSTLCDLLILDEACAAWQLDMVDRALLRDAVLDRPSGREVVLTGREPALWMAAAADYSTRMDCRAHPYHRGVTARRGVEF